MFVGVKLNAFLKQTTELLLRHADAIVHHLDHDRSSSWMQTLKFR
jgi:hypothetical protein